MTTKRTNNFFFFEKSSSLRFTLFYGVPITQFWHFAKKIYAVIALAAVGCWSHLSRDLFFQYSAFCFCHMVCSSRNFLKSVVSIRSFHLKPFWSNNWNMLLFKWNLAHGLIWCCWFQIWNLFLENLTLSTCFRPFWSKKWKMLLFEWNLAHWLFQWCWF